MITGMIPMALAIGQGSEETAPLGQAVSGGLVCATAETLLVLPTVFGIVQKGASIASPSLDPEDPNSPNAIGLDRSCDLVLVIDGLNCHPIPRRKAVQGSAIATRNVAFCSTEANSPVE